MITKNDFIEMEFTGSVKNGEVFDTNVKADAEKIGLKIDGRPFIVCVGHNMLIKGLDDAVIGKEIEKNYSIELPPENAFGPRNKSLVKLMPLKIFEEKKVYPRAGMTLALDDMLVKIISVSGGRVLADFNNPLAGKDIIYNFKIKRKVEDTSEKVSSLTRFFLNQDFEFKVQDKKIIFELEQFYQPLIDALNTQFKEALGCEMILTVKKEVENKKIAEKAEEKKE